MSVSPANPTMKRLSSCLFAVLFPLICVAQSPLPTGTIQGSVRDSTGAVIVGVRVTAKQQDSGGVRIAESDETGQFRFGSLAIGQYSLRLEQHGFTTVLVKSFLVSVGQTVVQNIVMKPAEVAASLDVQEQPEALETSALPPAWLWVMIESKRPRLKIATT